MRKKRKRCYSGIGGQAVLEGIMMKNNDRYSVAVRKPDGGIEVKIEEYAGVMGENKLAKAPFIRGVFAFIDSMVLGTRCLNYSASFYEEEETPSKKSGNSALKKKAESLLMVLTTVVAVIFAVGLFMVLPYFISNYLKSFVRNESLLGIIEGVIRILIFVLYVLLISLMKDIRRVYMYHGAEHKCINCIERGRELTVENVMRSSKQHRRCGTSFLLFVMLVSVVVFFFIRVDNMALKVVLRILLIPVIAGIAFEIIRLAGRFDNWLVRMISAPGLWLQGLTTKEPDESMVEVAIKAVEAVFDWKAYLWENFGYEDGEEAAERQEEYTDEAEEYAEEPEEYMYEAEEYAEELEEYMDEAEEYAEESEEYMEDAEKYIGEAEEPEEYADKAEEYTQESKEYTEDAEKYLGEAQEPEDCKEEQAEGAENAGSTES